jgi:hypothetical protein
MLPDLLDTYLPTTDTKALLLALVRAHAQNAVPLDVRSGFGLPPLVENEIRRALDIAAWLETVPTRMQ